MATGGKKEGSSNLLKVGTLTLGHDDLDIWGVVVVGDKLVITDGKSSKVRVYRRHDGMLLSSTYELESCPLGLCNVSDTEFCVAMKYVIIEIMSVQDLGFISRGKTFDLRSTFDSCYGVALWNDNIVVSGRKDNTTCWCVVSLQDGRPDKLHKVCEGNFSYLTVKQDMAYISCVAYSDDSGVYGFNLLNPSQPTYTYKHKELVYPHGITVSDIGDLFVCDFYSSIYHLTGNCELVTIYKNDLPRYPIAIFWDSGVLYLTSWRNNAITMYKTPQPGPAIPAKAMTKLDSEDQKEKRRPVLGTRASEQAKVSQKGKIFRVKQEAKISPLRPVISVDPVKQLTQTLSETGPAIPSKDMNTVDSEDQKKKKQEAKISPIRPVISVDPVEQLTQTLSETGIHDSILMQLSNDLISSDWRFFFRELSDLVTDEDIVEIEYNYRHNGVREQIYQLLRFSNKKGILNKTNMMKALESINRVDLVTKYTQETFPDS